MDRTLSYGITVRPCWMHTLPFSIVTMKNVKVEYEDGIEVIYYDIEGDDAWRHKAHQMEGHPPFVWAPDGFELPGDGETVEVRTHDLWGYHILIFDWDWFVGLQVMHDSFGRTCPACLAMKAEMERVQMGRFKP